MDPQTAPANPSGPELKVDYQEPSSVKDSKSKDTPAPPAEEPRAVYEVLVDGPTKVGGVLAYKGARLNLTKAQADVLNAAQPGTVKFLGV